MQLTSKELQLGDNIRHLFPIFEGHVRRLSYLDSAATSQKPQVVIDRLAQFLSKENANIHRGTYSLGAKATEYYDRARATVAKFLNAAPESIIFTKGATEAINLVSYSLQDYFKQGDTILLTLLEHHSNIVPWQLLAERAGLKIKFVGVGDDGLLDLEELERHLKKYHPKLLAVTGLSNAIGTPVPVQKVVAMAHQAGCKVLIDAAQAAAHQKINVAAIDCDFLVFSGHKVYGPTGIGVLYAKEELLDVMKPFHGGGDMIETVTTNGSTFAHGPRKFEAGTQPIAEAIGLASALEFIEAIGFERIVEHDLRLTANAIARLKSIKGVRLFGPASSGGESSSIVSFNLEQVHPHDLSSIADTFNVQIRGGTHCAMPLMDKLQVPATARLSFGVYSDFADLDALCLALEKARNLFS